MSTAIAFLSGKGGSGKTSVSLSIADLLSRCEVRTLLVDCDLSTNGATYFFESRLVGHNQRRPGGVYSFIDIINTSHVSSDYRPIQVNQYYHFFPSVSEISEHNIISNDAIFQSDEYISTFDDFILWAKQTYEVVLFDCQAGYTELFSLLLPKMDVDLFVLEPDSITASAMRNLHLKIGKYLGHAKLYQIFNRATEEEYEIYSKIVGTFFINIGTLLFDWKIRQAFSRSQIPDLEHNSAKFGADLCDICKTAISDATVQDRIGYFSLNLKVFRAEEKREQIEKSIREKRKTGPLIVAFTNVLMACICAVSVLTIQNEVVLNVDHPSIVLLCIMFILIGMMVMLEFSLVSQFKQSSRKSLERELKSVNKEIEELERLRKNVKNNL